MAHGAEYIVPMICTMSHPFEINVALIGYVSVGKTTFLNALLKDKYSEVSMRRTTSGVNKFRISTRSSNEKSTCHRSSGSTLEEISKDNKAFRDVDKLHVKTFDIEIDEPFFEMRDDTKLVLIDVPGKCKLDSGVWCKFVFCYG